MATLADLLTFNLPMERTYKQAGVENPLLKTLLPVAVGAAIPGLSGLRRASAHGGRRAARRAGGSLDDWFDDMVRADDEALGNVVAHTGPGRQLQQDYPLAAQSAVLDKGADLDTMGAYRQSLDRGARRSLADQLSRENRGRPGTLPLWADPEEGKRAVQQQLERPKNLFAVPHEGQDVPNAAAWYTPDEHQLYMNRLESETVDPGPFQRIQETRRQFGWPDNPESIGYHEGIHLAEGRPGLNWPVEQPADFQHPALREYLNENYLENVLEPTMRGGGPPVSPYYHQPAEVLALTNQLRDWHGIQPGEQLSETDVANLLKNMQMKTELLRSNEGDLLSGGSSLGAMLRFGQSYSPRKLAELIKYIPVAGGASVPLAMQSQRQRT